MTNEPKAMREIHAIRERIYEDTKDLSAEAHTEYFRKAAQEMIDKHGLNVKRPTPAERRKII